ncbi:MAG: hypothetical protein QF435_14170, partial [Arenicellales bacterium]|nr:hypothetical protein [Arenicellales bacterium]
HRRAIVSLTERKSRLVLLKAVTITVIDLLKPLVARAHTITADNGKKFAYHERIARDLRNRCLFFASLFLLEASC